MDRLSEELLETARRVRVIEDLSTSEEISHELRSVLKRYVNSLREAVDAVHDEWATAIRDAFRREGY